MTGEVSSKLEARAEKAMRLRPYFDLQLRFAEAMAAACGYGWARSLVLNTNFHRRFALGDWNAGSVRPFWADYLTAMENVSGRKARLDVTCDFFARAEAETLPTNQKEFGCFSLEPLKPEGVVRIHFGNRFPVRDDLGPLSQARQPDRLAELRALFAYVYRKMPEARVVHGGSWLYNVEAYRRLFPPSFAQSRVRLTGLRNFAGTSSWGQFLDHRGSIKPDLRTCFLENLKTLDPENPADSFPMPALGTRAPVGVFYSFYGV
ncbi:MAG: hypothetical protein KF769_03610 [Parvibaculum sp.]|nr:hypothetical protein [Parvibaculum sp.]